MPTFVMRDGKIVEKGQAEYDSGGPYVISDEMPATRHMATGKYHTSKAAFRSDTKASGCIEYGNETKYLSAPRKPVPLDRAKRRDDIRRSIYNLRNGIGG